MSSLGKDFKASGSAKASDKSRYWYYVPSTAVKTGDAPVLFWVGAGGGKKADLKAFAEDSELTGVVLAASLEARNQTDWLEVDWEHTDTCLDHLKKTHGVDRKRVIFSGNSGGGASSWYNSTQTSCIGAIPYVGYVPQGTKPSKKNLYYVLTGAHDFNRYLSAQRSRNGANEKWCQARMALP